MGLYNREVGIAFGPQSAVGVIDPTIAALAGSLDLDDGIILGDVNAGIAESGITHSFTRRRREKGSVTGGFTRLSSDFLEEEVALSFACPAAGNRTTTPGTPNDFSFLQQKGLDALLGSVGLIGAASTASPAIGWRYSAGDVAIASARLFDSGGAWGIRDIKGNWSLSQTPGQVGIFTFTLSGIVESYAAVAFPTFDYEEQASVNAPSVSAVSPSWGGITRGWTDLTISCENQIGKFADSGSSTGESFEQEGRTISVDMTIRDDDSDLDFSRAELVRTTAPTSDLTATVGAAASGGDSAVAYQYAASNLEVVSYAPETAGKRAASKISAECTGTTDGEEFSIAFL